MLKPKVSVVIPFFQRDKGLLGRAVKSVFASEGNLFLEVVVVDDGSPVSARGELKGFLGKVRLVEQSNRGPAAARNAGLDVASGDFIAFLDSDDCFTPEHLQRALKALQYGDFYFSAFLDIDKKTNFSRLSFPLTFLGQTAKVAGLHNVFVLQGPFGTLLEAGPGLVGTSTIVLRKSALGQTRFNESLSLGEDYFFCLEMFAKDIKCFYSQEIGNIGGKGVSVFRKHLGKTRFNPLLVERRLLFWKLVNKQFAKLGGEKKRLIREQIVRFYKDLLWAVMENKDIRLFVKSLSMPQYFCAAVLSMLWGKFVGKSI